VTARQVIGVLKKINFRWARQKGSHAIYKNAEGKRATVPVHSRKTLHPKVVQNILRDAGLSVEEFIALM
jgi:predicted RNA binding protein YcfA (HicA-like mRNA interferase family)